MLRLREQQDENAFPSLIPSSFILRTMPSMARLTPTPVPTTQDDVISRLSSTIIPNASAPDGPPLA